MFRWQTRVVRYGAFWCIEWRDGCGWRRDHNLYCTRREARMAARTFN